MKSILGLLVLFMLAPVFPAPAPPAADEAPFVLGVLRRDGVVFPFASFTGKDWEALWPADLRWTELPLLLGDVPSRWWGKAGPQRELTVWSDGTARGTVHLDRPVMLTPACQRRIGLTTDYRPSEIPPPPSVRPYPKDGLVISGAQRIDAVVTVAPGSPELIAVATTLITQMDQAEQSAINMFTDWDHPVPRKQRKTTPVEIEALYRAPMGEAGWTAYHVEAVKRYAPGKDDEGCGLITSASGWLVIGPKGKHWAGLSARVTYCDRKGVAYFLPLGIMHLGDRAYWIFQTAGYDLERYSVARPTSRTVEFEAGYSAGSCGGF